MKKFHEEWAIVATIDPIDANNADSSTDIVDMSKWSELAFIVMLGVVASSGTFDFALYEDEASDMSGQSAISGKAITQFTDSDDAKQAIISLRPEELSSNAMRYVRGVMANSAHSQLAAVLVLGRAKHQPASDDDLSTVDEIVN